MSAASGTSLQSNGPVEPGPPTQPADSPAPGEDPSAPPSGPSRSIAHLLQEFVRQRDFFLGAKARDRPKDVRRSPTARTKLYTKCLADLLLKDGTDRLAENVLRRSAPDRLLRYLRSDALEVEPAADRRPVMRYSRQVFARWLYRRPGLSRLLSSNGKYNLSLSHFLYTME